MKTLKKITMTLALALTLSSIIPNVSTTNQVQTVEAKAKTTKTKKSIKKTKKPIKKTKKNKVKINKTKATLNKGKKVTLKVTGTKSKVKWSTNKKSIATVTSKGVVTAKKKGTATITAKVGKKKYTCKITVKQPTTKPINNKPDRVVGENDPKIYTLLKYDVDNSKNFRTVVVRIANEGNKPITIKSEAYLDNDATDPSKSGKVYLPDFINNTTIDSITLEPDPKNLKWISFAFYPFERTYVDKKSKLTFNFICDGVEYTTTASYYSAHNDYTKVGDLK